jgi:hypothetical protein
MGHNRNPAPQHLLAITASILVVKQILDSIKMDVSDNAFGVNNSPFLFALAKDVFMMQIAMQQEILARGRNEIRQTFFGIFHPVLRQWRFNVHIAESLSVSLDCREVLPHGRVQATGWRRKVKAAKYFAKDIRRTGIILNCRQWRARIGTFKQDNAPVLVCI